MRIVITTEIPEGTTPTLSFTIVDHDGNGFKPDTLALTLYDETDKTVINARDGQDVLDTNGVTTASNGETVFQLVKEDNVIVHSNSGLETHIAFFEWTWNTGLYVGNIEIELHVRNLAKKL